MAEAQLPQDRVHEAQAVINEQGAPGQDPPPVNEQVADGQPQAAADPAPLLEVTFSPFYF